MAETLKDIRNTPLIGQVIVDGLVKIDNGTYLDIIQQRVAEANPQTDEEKFAFLKELPKKILADAITAYRAGNRTKPVLTAYESNMASMGEIFEGGFGTCRHFITISLLAAERLKVPFALLGNADYQHTFGYAQLGNTWELVDPFAEVYYENNGKPGQMFPNDCYKISDKIMVFVKSGV